MCQNFAEKERSCKSWSNLASFLFYCVFYFLNLKGLRGHPYKQKRGSGKENGPGTHNPEALVRHS